MRRLLPPILVLLVCGIARAQVVYAPLPNVVVHQGSDPAPTCTIGKSPDVFVNATGCTWYCGGTAGANLGTYTASPCGSETAAAPGVTGDIPVNVDGSLDTVSGFTVNTSTGQVSMPSVNLPITSALAGIVYSNSLPWMHNYSGTFGYVGSGADLAAEARNIFVGLGAGNFSIPAGTAVHEGRENIGIGHYALHSLTTGYQNSGVGRDALGSVTSGRYNVGHGSGALQSVTTGESNTSIGAASATDMTTGANNVTIGDSSGFNIVTGSKNTLVGASSNVNAGAAANRTALGYNVNVDTDKKAIIGNTDTEAGGAGLGTTNVELRGTATLRDPTSGFKGTLSAAGLSADRAIALPNAAGTLITSAQANAAYQLTDQDLTDIAALACSNGQVVKRTGGVWTCGTDDTLGSGAVTASTPGATDFIAIWSGTSSIDRDAEISVNRTTNTIAANISGTAANATLAANVTTNANLTGPITSVGNATTLNDNELAIIANLAAQADRFPYYTSGAAGALATLTSQGRAILDDAAASDQRTTIGLGNVDNTSDLTKDGATATLTNKTLTAPILGAVLVAGLPSAAGADGRLYVVTDGLTSGSCTTGGGSFIALCRDNGASWGSLSGTSTGGTFTPADSDSLVWSDGATVTSFVDRKDLSTSPDVIETSTSSGITWNVPGTFQGGINGTYGVQLDGNSSSLENPTANTRATMGFIGSAGLYHLGIKNFGINPYRVVDTYAGDVGDFQCLNDSCDLETTGVGAGTCTNCDLTIDAKGRVTVKGNGTSGGITNLTAATDTDWTSYTSKVGYVPAVNAGATGLDLVPVLSVTETAPAENDILIRNGAGVWVNTASALITESAPADGATIVRSGSTWIDGQLNLADTDAVTGALPTGNLASGATLDTEWDTAAEVNTAFASGAQFLTNDGTAQALSASKTITPATGGWFIFKRAGTSATDALMEFQSSAGAKRMQIGFNNAGSYRAWSVFASDGTTERSWCGTTTGTCQIYDGNATGVPAIPTSNLALSWAGAMTFSSATKSVFAAPLDAATAPAGTSAANNTSTVATFTAPWGSGLYGTQKAGATGSAGMLVGMGTNTAIDQTGTICTSPTGSPASCNYMQLGNGTVPHITVVMGHNKNAIYDGFDLATQDIQDVADVANKTTSQTVRLAQWRNGESAGARNLYASIATAGSTWADSSSNSCSADGVYTDANRRCNAWDRLKVHSADEVVDIDVIASRVTGGDRDGVEFKGQVFGATNFAITDRTFANSCKYPDMGDTTNAAVFNFGGGTAPTVTQNSTTQNHGWGSSNQSVKVSWTDATGTASGITFDTKCPKAIVSGERVAARVWAYCEEDLPSGRLHPAWFGTNGVDWTGFSTGTEYTPYYSPAIQANTWTELRWISPTSDKVAATDVYPVISRISAGAEGAFICYFDDISQEIIPASGAGSTATAVGPFIPAAATAQTWTAGAYFWDGLTVVDDAGNKSMTRSVSGAETRETGSSTSYVFRRDVDGDGNYEDSVRKFDYVGAFTYGELQTGNGGQGQPITTSNYVNLYEFHLPVATKFDRIRINVDTAFSQATATGCSVSIYGRPNATMTVNEIVSAESQNLTTTGAKTFTVSATRLEPGVYYFGVGCDDNDPGALETAWKGGVPEFTRATAFNATTGATPPSTADLSAATFYNPVTDGYGPWFQLFNAATEVK